jgi:membrane protease YdiL (CAAX protease family)
MKCLSKQLILIFILLLICGSLFAQESRADGLEPADVLINSFLPGYAQFKMGDPAWPLYGFGMPLIIGGTALTYIEPGYIDFAEKPLNTSGLFLSALGSSLHAYSGYDVQRAVQGKDTPGYLSLLFAPFKFENIFAYDTLPFLLYGFSSALEQESIESLGRYFTRDSVRFFGRDVSPETGFGLNLLLSSSVNLFVASSEEIIFRGSLLESYGIHVSSLLFGAAHLLNVLAYEEITTEIWFKHGQQAIFAAGLGYYLAYLTEKDASMEKAITIHYWNNVVAMMMIYMLEQESGEAYIGLPFISVNLLAH